MFTLAAIKASQLNLIVGPNGYTRRRMLTLIVEATLQGPVLVLAGGNRFDFYEIAYTLAAETGAYRELLEKQLFLSRAGQCYEFVELLCEHKDSGLLTLVPDFLDTFQDDSVPEREADELFFDGVQALRQASKRAPVILTAQEGPSRKRLFKALLRAANEIERAHRETTTTPRIFS